FFFSSRRPHTRFSRDWSSDVCSSDLFTRFFALSNASLWMDEIVILEESVAGEFRTVSAAAHWVHLYPVRYFIGMLGATPFGLRRSEERRVGKECRGLWGTVW